MNIALAVLIALSPGYQPPPPGPDLNHLCYQNVAYQHAHPKECSHAIAPPDYND